MIELIKRLFRGRPVKVRRMTQEELSELRSCLSHTSGGDHHLAGLSPEEVR